MLVALKAFRRIRQPKLIGDKSKGRGRLYQEISSASSSTADTRDCYCRLTLNRTPNDGFLCTAWIARLLHRARSVSKVMQPVGVAWQFTLLTLSCPEQLQHARRSLDLGA
jgi:hypothetical protein